MKMFELIDRVAAAAGLEKRETKKTLDAAFSEIVEAVKRGEEVSIPAFGKFKVKHAPARQGRNPATGKQIEIAASRKLAFTVAKQVKDALAN